MPGELELPVVPRCAPGARLAQPVEAAAGLDVLAQLRQDQVGASAQQASLDPQLAELVSFSGCESLLRGSHLTNILGRFGSIFATSEGSAETYALSRQVAGIDTFISHNWATSRWQKYSCLAFHFNFAFAVTATTMCMGAITVLTAVAILPVYQEGGAPYPSGLFCKLLCAPVFTFTTCFGHKLRNCMGCRHVVFLDKTCIHQIDPDVQRRGIEKLGAFLCHSASMVVVYTDMYLQKLWTVYEVASFLYLHPIDDMTVIPTFVPVVVFVSLLATYVASLLALVSDLYWGFYYTEVILVFIFLYPLMLALRSSARDKAAMTSRLANFAIHTCLCSCEDDRPRVRRNIAMLMRAIQAVRPEDADADALAAFDSLVRSALPKALVASVGPNGLLYRHVLVVAACLIAAPRLDKLAGLAFGMQPHHAVAAILRDAWVVTGQIPVTFAFLARWSARCLHLNGGRTQALLVCGQLLGAIGYVAMDTGGNALLLWASESSVGLAALVACGLANFLCAIALYSGRSIFHWYRAKDTFQHHFTGPHPVESKAEI